MDQQQLEKRARTFALRVMKPGDPLPNTRSGNAIAHQRVRSGTAVGANYRATCRACSKAEFVAKIGIVEEGGLPPSSRVSALHREADELPAIMAASRISASRRR